VTAECSGDFCRYATLSHRWGSDSVLCLTTSNMEAFKMGLALSTLSPTFQYAVATTKDLGIRYLWIDSLCIVQDSMEDWRSESGLMSSVYGHSMLTIAILSIKTQVGRLSDDLSNVSSLICQIKARWTDVASEDCYIFEDSMWQDCVSFAPLNRRAWVLQERILSKRILYVHETQYFWECHQQTACEVFPVQMPPQMRCTPGKISHKEARPNIEQIVVDHHDYKQDPYFFWKRVVEKYTLCELTRAEDKLIAVSGLAQRVAAITNDSYLAGLWARHLEVQLMWQVQDPPTAKFPVPVSPEDSCYRAPSWSWASVDGNVLMRTPETDEDNLTLIEIASADVKTIMEDRTGQVQNGFITVTGVLIPAAYHLDASRSSGGRLVVASMGSSKEFNIFVDFDVHPNEAVEDLLCLPFSHYLLAEVDGEKGKAGVEGLVLRKNGSSASFYFRVGIFSMYGRSLCQLAGLDFGDRQEGEMGQVSSARPTQLLVIA
jgi:hypothetical protein